MDLGKLAAITIIDVYVVSALAAFSLSLWVARRYIGWLLKLVPVAIALAGTLVTYGTWKLGEQIGWDTPGSPGILIVYFATCVSVWRLRQLGAGANEQPFVMPGGRVVPWLGAALIVALLVRATAQAWLWTGGVAAVASLAYLAKRR